MKCHEIAIGGLTYKFIQNENKQWGLVKFWSMNLILFSMTDDELLDKSSAYRAVNFLVFSL